MYSIDSSENILKSSLRHLHNNVEITLKYHSELLRKWDDNIKEIIFLDIYKIIVWHKSCQIF